MEIDEETKEKMDKLPISLRYMAKYMFDVFNKIVNGECNENEVLSTMATLEENHNGRYHDQDLLNYDKAGIALGFGTTNRNAMKQFLDMNGIKQVYINNKPCGFKRSEVMMLAARLEAERKEKSLNRAKTKRILGKKF